MSFLEQLAKTAGGTLNDLAGVAIKNLQKDSTPAVAPAAQPYIGSPNTAPYGVQIGVPFYQQPWFVPAAIGVGILFALLYVFKGR